MDIIVSKLSARIGGQRVKMELRHYGVRGYYRCSILYIFICNFLSFVILKLHTTLKYLLIYSL